jgi:S1-C subfamily serine protease
MSPSRVLRPAACVLAGVSLFLTSCLEERLAAFRAGVGSGSGPGASGRTAATSVLRVHATNQGHNFVRPWEKLEASRRSGLGALLEDGRVLVTAELVENHTYIELERADSGEKRPARIVGLDYEADLALLEPADAADGFLDGMKPLPLELGSVPGDTLEVWQLEDNGTPASTGATMIKAGVGRYFVDGSFFLTYVLRGSLQYRASSFTLPVIKDGKLAGILLSYDSKEQTSEILPAPIIRHFLDDLADGEYAGFPNLGLSYASTLDDQLRKYAKLNGHEGGIYVRRVARDGAAKAAGIQQGDVILEIAGKAIDARGNYDHPLYGKLNFSHLVRGDASVGQSVPVRLVRDGQEQTIDLVLTRKTPESYKIDPFMFDRGPKFLILGGLIFQELTLPYLKAWGDQWVNRAPFKLVHAHANQEVFEDEGEEGGKLVILSAVILTPATVGYEQIGNLIVTQVNGKPIRHIRDLKDALSAPTDGIHRIEFDDFPEVIFLDARMAEAINGEFGPRLGIASLERLD